MGLGNGQLIVISGLSGTGKGTLVKKLLEHYNESYALSISATTRAPRAGEVDGRDYFFKTKEEFGAMIEAGELLEHACFVGNYYGTPADYVLKQREQGKNVILEIEIQGALQIKKKYPDTVLLFVLPPGADELERRLKGRGTETDEVIRARLSRASEEAKYIEEYDFVVINDDLDECVRQTHVIIEAAGCQPECCRDFISSLQEELKKFS